MFLVRLKYVFENSVITSIHIFSIIHCINLIDFWYVSYLQLRLTRSSSVSMGSVTSYDLTSRANIINMKFENNNSSEFEEDEVFEDPDSEKKQKIAPEVKKQPKPAPRHSRQQKQTKQADSVLTGSSGAEQVRSLKRLFRADPGKLNIRGGRK